MSKVDVVSAKAGVDAFTGIANRLNLILVLGSIAIICLSALILWSFSSSKKIDYGIISIGPTVERVPRISNSGDRLIAARKVGEGINLDVVEYDLVNRGFHSITTVVGLETDPIWSPDDKRIAFLQRASDVVSMFEIDLDNQVHTLLTRADLIPNLSAMDWSPDGSAIAFSSGFQGKWPFVVNELDLNTLESNPITVPSENIIGDVNPRYSPDGTGLAFIRCTQESELYGQFIQAAGDIHLLNLESGETIQLTFENKDITGLDWSESGKEIYYMDIENHFNFRLKTYSVATGDQRVIYESDKLLRNIDVQGETAAFEEWGIEFQIVGYDKTTNRVLDRISSENQKNWYPKINNRGDQLAYVSNASGTSELWLKDLNNSEVLRLTNFEGPLVSSPNWSPDDTSISISVSSNGTDKVYLINPVDATISETTIEGKAVFGNSNSLLYSFSRSKCNSEVLKVDLTSKSSLEVLNMNITSLEYFDEKLYYTVQGQNGIWSYDLNTKFEKLIIPSVSQRDNNNWTLTNELIYFTKRLEDRRTGIFKYDLINSDLELFHTNIGGYQSANFSGISVAPNENNLYLTLSGPILSEIRLIEL